jgi:hypothetical protein
LTGRLSGYQLISYQSRLPAHKLLVRIPVHSYLSVYLHTHLLVKTPKYTDKPPDRISLHMSPVRTLEHNVCCPLGYLYTATCQETRIHLPITTHVHSYLSGDSHTSTCYDTCTQLPVRRLAYIYLVRHMYTATCQDTSTHLKSVMILYTAT